MPPYLNEAMVESAALDWFADLGYTTLHDEDIRPGAPHAERDALDQVILIARLRNRLTRLNPLLNPPAIEDLIRRIIHIHDVPSLVHLNRTFHHMLVEGVSIPVLQRDGSILHRHARLADFDDPNCNDWLVVQQFTVRDGKHKRRPDLLVFLNGIPIADIELKNPGDEQATVTAAYHQLQTYKDELVTLNTYNEIMVATDGLTARVGSLTATREWFLPWRTPDGGHAGGAEIELETLIRGLFNRQHLLTYLRHFIVFDEAPSGKLTKVIAAYHQFYAVNIALEHTLRATAQRLTDEPGVYTVSPPNGTPETVGNRRIGVIWHTQGSGKSLTMAFYTGRVVQNEAMRNPTILVLTDRNDLDDQLFGTFARCKELLRQEPQQAGSRADLRTLLDRTAGGVIFTTVQKFMPDEKGDAFPTLSRRTNIVVIADEAHRSQYDFIDGFARHIHDALPNAAFIGFTGTPIESTDINTRLVFGDYISTYDIQRAVRDKATVPIYYEGRVAKLHLSEHRRPHLDEAFDEITEAQEIEGRERLKTKWAALEALVGAPSRIHQIAADLVNHLEHRQRALQGKAMVVCMSRRICIELHNAIAAIRPAWCHPDDAEGSVKVIMTGSATDPTAWQQHIRSKKAREDLARRFKDPDDPFQLVIVRDMWLTGFDAPCLHTMYIDKPMRGHGLMQAIARVNRVFKDKPGGLIVDYLGLADQLQHALHTYTSSGGTGQTALNQEEAVVHLKREHETCCDFFYGFDWSVWRSGTGQSRLHLLPGALQHITQQTEEQRKLYIATVANLSKAFALSVPHPEALALRDDIAFFQQVKAILVKPTLETDRRSDLLESAVNQLLSEAIVADRVIDIFAAAGIPRPDISILSDDFLHNVHAMPQKDLAVELLRKLLNGEIRHLAHTNAVQSRSFTELLERSMNAYHNRTVTTYQIIEELIALAKQMREQRARGQNLGLTDEEVAFYDALGVNDSAVQVLGDDTLMTIARELVASVRRNATIDWEIRESVRAKLRVAIKNILRHYGYPPDKREKATTTVLEQAELLASSWVAA